MINQEHVRVVKLAAEELIAEVDLDVEGDVLILKNPVIIQMEPTEEGSVVLRMYPWLTMTHDAEYPVRKDHVITTATALPKLVEAYVREHSNIELPANPGLVMP